MTPNVYALLTAEVIFLLWSPATSKAGKVSVKLKYGKS